MTDFNEGETFSQDGHQAAAAEPAAAPRPARRPSRKAAKPPVSMQVSQMQALLDSCVDTSGPGEAMREVREGVDGAGIAYLADGRDI